MSDAKKKYVKRAGDNTTRWLLLGLILKDERCRLIHGQVAWPILEAWYESLKGCRASVGFLAGATGLTRGSVATATADLVAWGYFTRRMGVGKAPTVYFPTWSLVLQPQDANGIEASVLQSQDASVLQPRDAKFGSVLQLQEEPHLNSPLKGALIYSGESDTHAGLAGGLAATAAARDPFDRFWEAYPRKHKPVKAEAAWKEISPDNHLAELIIHRAQTLAAHYIDHPVEKRWMKEPANWLLGKGWLEDLPIVHGDQKRATKSSPAVKTGNNSRTASNDNKEATDRPARWVGEISQFVSPGRHSFIIGDATHIRDGAGNQEIVLSLDIDDGQYIVSGVPHRFFAEHRDETLQRRGNKHLIDACNAVGVADIDDVKILVGKRGVADIGNDGSIRYLPLLETDEAA